MNSYHEMSLVTNQACGGRTEQTRPPRSLVSTLSNAAFVQCTDIDSESSGAKVIQRRANLLR